MPIGAGNIVTEPGGVIGDALTSHFDLDIVVFRIRNCLSGVELPHTVLKSFLQILRLFHHYVFPLISSLNASHLARRA